jgi:tight adherence protein C
MLVIALILGLVLVALAVIAIVKAISLPAQGNTEAVEQIGAYGFGPSTEIATASGSRRSPTELLSALVNRLTNRSGADREEQLQKRLVAAGLYSQDPQAFIRRQTLTAVGMTVGWLVFSVLAGAAPALIVLGFFIAPMFGWILPSFLLSRRASHRLRQIDKALPEMIDLLVVTVEAGVGFVASLRLASQIIEGPLADELRLTLQEQSMGLSSAEALLGMGKRADTSGVRSFARAIVQGETLGVSIGQILRNLAAEMRKKRRALAEEKAQKAPIKMLFPLIFLIFPAIFVVLLLPALLSIAKSLGG